MATFYERVLPAVGPFTLLTGTTGPDGKLSEQRHWNGLKTHADVEREVQRLSTLPVNVFLAVGSYAGKNRKDPIAKRCLYLDLDGKSFGSVEQAVRELGTFVKAVGLPPPSIYVHSGRGVHVYWVLDRDVPVAEWQPVADALKAKCKELGFAADPSVTADAARILRAPGTLNRKGETPLPCRVIADNGSSYALDQFSRQLGAAVSSAATKLSALVSNDDLVTKRDLDEKTADQVAEMLEYIQLSEMGSRDEWITVLCAVQDWSKKSEEGFDLFHDWSAGQPGYVSRDDCRKTWDSFSPGGGIGIGTLIKLARDGGYTPTGPQPVVPDAASFAEQASSVPATQSATAPAISVQTGPMVQTGVVTSPLMIAAAHAVRATGKSRFDHNDAVQWLANEFVLITEQEGIFYSMTNRAPMARPVIDDLLTRYMPLNANGVPINASMIMRRYGTVHSVAALGFFPGAPSIYTEGGVSYVNTHTNPPDMIPGTASEVALIDDFWAYLFPNPEDQLFGTYLKQFYGHVVQRPAVKIASAPLMISKEFGTGKTTAMQTIPAALVGPRNARMVSNKVLRSAFSDYLSGAHFIHFDEVHINGRWDSDDTANSMKNLITGATIEVHPKGLKPFNIPNRIFITATSNYDDAITLPSNDERRWGVYYLRPVRTWTTAQKAAYFNVLHRWITSPRGAGVLRWYFNQVDLTGFNPQAAPPATNDKAVMIHKSQREEVQILQWAAQEGVGPFDKDLVTHNELFVYLQNETGKTHSAMMIREYVKKAFPNAHILGQVRNGPERVRPYAWRNVEKWAVATPDEIRDGLKSSSSP